MLVFLSFAVILAGGATLYFAIKSREFRKFLSGAFFVSGGVQIYLAQMGISIPLYNLEIVQTPEIGYFRGTMALIFSVLCFYFGFIKKSK